MGAMDAAVIDGAVDAASDAAAGRDASGADLMMGDAAGSADAAGSDARMFVDLGGATTGDAALPTAANAGCGCVVAGRAPVAAGPLVALALLALLAWRRRRALLP